MQTQENNKKRKATKRTRLSLGIQLAAIALVADATTISPVLAAPAASANHAPATDVHNFDVPTLALDQALVLLARQAGVELYLGSNDFTNSYGNPVKGRLSLDAALQTLLANQGVSYSLTGSAERPIIQVQSAPNSTGIQAGDLHPTYVMGMEGKQSRDEKGYNDIYDQDISSVYAGKEQIERYKGAAPADMFKGMLNVYSGDSRNSGALDPNIRGIQGPGRVPLTIDGTEQAITAYRGYMGANNRNYIDPNLIGSIKVLKGPNLERNVYSGIGGAVVASTLNVDDVLKQDQEYGGELKIEGSNNSVSPKLPTLMTGQMPSPGYEYSPIRGYYDHSLYKHPRTSSSNKLLSSDDSAYRLALATRQEKFELLAAYALREKGNHYAGKNKSGFYSSGKQVNGEFDYIPNLATIYKPGDEVPNTSSKMESWLGKAKLKIDENQSLEFGYRDTDALYGEILPSRISFFKPGTTYDAATNGVPQWPLSHVQSKAYNLEYNLKPEGNPWVDFYSNLWMTNTRSDTYSSGGVPNQTTIADPVYRNTALANAKHDRVGLTASNKFKLLDSLDLTLGGSYQHEKLGSNDNYYDPIISDTLRMYPRAGRREEQEYNFKFDWRPVSFAKFEAGMRYSSYWAFDDYLKSAQDKSGVTTQLEETGRQVDYTTRKTLTESEWQADIDRQIANNKVFWDMFDTPESERQEIIDVIKQQTPRVQDTQHKADWASDAKGRYSRDNNPCINGLSAGENIISCSASGNGEGYEKDIKAKHQKDSGWTPSLSATFYTSENGRVYLRYSEAIRYPSMFESTIGFSSSVNPWGLEPEHAHNYEAAYIHNLAGWGGSESADIKLSYYYNTTKNVIERDPQLRFSNLEKQVTSGVEFQGRYDNGRFFTDMSIGHVLKNRVCDENSAVSVSTDGSTPNCVDDGFVGGYLVSMAMPEWTANLGLGARFLDRKLEVGGRAIYYRQHENKFYDNYPNSAMVSYYLNTPMSWDKIITYDAYVNYKLTDDASIELTGTNLSNLYYIDPLTRSAMPAPGRTLKLAFTTTF
ncbi:TonB-dependent receptor plug domain-containing protein [Pseudomonas gessardii]|uniref:TonB-dependent receptor plug domain-containing protein n=1 Tax=Pseudomonas gessardii TaxID=78544 RepID=A0ABS9F4I3_9PSED|nr:TonB-dependent receptor [Pseudomonas gessardii]MCF4979651.1 TonB-dependent receptor plug domain-containing protein [Pseudomonas gessardii]MCF5084537.1 TonB-dependent receptor plug domain-containing protein [Pseudomonas gessardii]MCF5095194.1 TonB-dependent receptor plug domain-containing protein [Pseudomonas gessardii]MCF5107292.1 TonB-dependent receptor plug domain-containing protein [Pseudomonas gessardii]